MSTHLTPIESIREKEKEFEENFKEELIGDDEIPVLVIHKKRQIVDIDDIKTHINLTLTSFIEAEIEKWKGAMIEIDGTDEYEFPERWHDRKGHNSAISSVIEHLQELKKQLI